MQRERIALLGLLIDRRDIVDSVEEILALIHQYRQRHPSEVIEAEDGHPPAYICTPNVDFLSHVHGWGWNRPRHPELLNSILKASLATPDGMPLLWLAACLGSPLPERVSGADLVPLLAEAMGAREMSLFLLGGEENIASEARNRLIAIDPGLRVAGAATPRVDIDGERLVESEQRDALILEEIHHAAPDLLLIGLGHPKQELWFERVKAKLRVPAAIGIGGALNFLVEKVPRAPEWIRSAGLEWAFRFYSEPKRLWKRYLYNLIHFFYLSFPLVFVHWINHLIFIAFRKEPPHDYDSSRLFLSQNHSIALIILPRHLEIGNCARVESALKEALQQDAAIVDFHRLKHFDLSGLGLLIGLWLEAKKEGKPIFAIGMGWSLCLLLKMHRAWTYFSSDFLSDFSKITDKLSCADPRTSLYEAINQEDDLVMLSFSGSLENSQDYDLLLQKLSPMLDRKECVVDLSYCSLVENRGFYFLLRLKQQVEGHNRSFKIVGASRELKQQFQIAEVEFLL